jgi:hypothetical protein
MTPLRHPDDAAHRYRAAPRRPPGPSSRAPAVKIFASCARLSRVMETHGAVCACQGGTPTYAT